MQTSFHFQSEHLITTTFFKFVEAGYFNFFLSFASSQNSFLILKLPQENIKEITSKMSANPVGTKYIYFENNQNIKAKSYLDAEENDIVFINLASYFTKKIESELMFLYLFKTLSSKDISFVGLLPNDWNPQFALLDLKSRFNGAIGLDFVNEANFDFYQVAYHFLYTNGMKVDGEVLRSIMLHVERDIKSLTIFVVELKKFVESHKVKINRNHFRIILENYEKRKG